MPRTAQPGDQFLLAYRQAKGENFLLQWVEIVEGETNTADRMVSLPARLDKLTAEIQLKRGSNCETNYVGFKLPIEKFIRPWGHTECGDGFVEKNEEPPPSNGIDR